MSARDQWTGYDRAMRVQRSGGRRVSRGSEDRYWDAWSFAVFCSRMAREYGERHRRLIPEQVEGVRLEALRVWRGLLEHRRALGGRLP